MMYPLIAIVTPVFNGAPFLKATLACVQAQTYPNIVHVVLDNASTDETPDLIRSAENGKVPLITKRNAEAIPQIANWNAAFSLVPSQAKYVKLLCADDLMREDCIAKMFEAAEKDDEIDFVAAVDVVNDRAKPHCLDGSQTIYSGKDYGARFLRGDIQWLSAAHMFFRATPERLSNPFRADVLDADFILRDLMSRKVAFLFEPLLFTRYHDNAVTARLGGGRQQLLREFRLFKEHGDRFLSTDEFARIERSRVRQILRHAIAWQMAGELPAAIAAYRLIADLDLKPTAIDYVLATGEWPLHKIWKALNGRKRLRENTFHESDFLPKNNILKADAN